MNLLDIASTKKRSIVDKWYGQIIATYPEPTARFLEGEQDAFANPVGHTIYRALEGLVEGFFQGEAGSEAISAHLDSIIRIRAVQELSPSEALTFIFQGKQIFKEELAQEISAQKIAPERLEAWIDGLALDAFDLYMQCRQQVYELRIKEVKNRVSRLLERARLSLDIPS